VRVRHKIAVAFTAVAAFSAVGVAFAAWTSSGTGAGSAQSTHDTPSHITATAVAPELYPGAASTVQVVVDNPNAYPVIITSFTAAQSPAVNGGACAAGSVFTDVASNTAGIAQTNTTTVIAPHGSGTYALSGHMIGNPAEACKDQTFPLNLSAALQSAA
jgi:hypothetical protein